MRRLLTLLARPAAAGRHRAAAAAPTAPTTPTAATASRARSFPGVDGQRRRRRGADGRGRRALRGRRDRDRGDRRGRRRRARGRATRRWCSTSASTAAPATSSTARGARAASRSPFPLTEGRLIPGFLDGLVGQTVRQPGRDRHHARRRVRPRRRQPDSSASRRTTAWCSSSTCSRPPRSPWPRASQQAPPADVPELETNADGIPPASPRRQTPTGPEDVVVAEVGHRRRGRRAARRARPDHVQVRRPDLPRRQGLRRLLSQRTARQAPAGQWPA